MSRIVRALPQGTGSHVRFWLLGIVVTTLLVSGPVAGSASQLGASVMSRQISPYSHPPVVQGMSSFTASPFATCKWHIVTSPNAQADQNTFSGVTATSSGNAWAVGRTVSPIDGSIQPVVAHWNGTAWSLVSTPSVVSANLLSVKAISRTDAWAVGTVFDPNVGRLQTLAEHWNGTSWTIVTTPNVGSFNNLFNAVVANSTSDVWAFGFAKDSSGLRNTLAEHWNGSTWTVVPTPAFSGTDNTLTSGVANTSANVWAGGAINCQTGSCQTLTERWNGTKWKVIPSPDVNSMSNPINAMSSNGRTDMWAIGDFFTGSTFDTLAEHWNGTNWTIISSPDTTFNALIGSAAVNTSDVWAVGYYQNGSLNQPYSMNWNGSVWSTVFPAPVITTGGLLNGASTIPGTINVWAVGASFNSDSSPHLTLIEKFHC